MGLSFNEIKAVSKKFQKKYMTEEIGRYINMVGISSIAIKCKSELKLEIGEDPNDYCLSVGFSVMPPDSVECGPDIFEGARVFYNLVGTIHAL